MRFITQDDLLPGLTPGALYMKHQLMSLRDLAEEFGISTEHTDGLGIHRMATNSAMLAVLRSLGVAIDTADQADTIREQRKSEPPALLPPCLALRAHENAEILIAGQGPDSFRAELVREDGHRLVFEGTFADLPTRDERGRLELGPLPVGYHTLTLLCGERQGRCHLLAAPPAAYAAPEGHREWGVFAPLYALRDADDWGVGDFKTLGLMMAWCEELGASYLGTLPLLAANYREAFETSPYSPASRLFWNELYLDLESLSEKYPSEKLTDLLASSAFRRERASINALDLVDYARCHNLKRQVLQHIANAAWECDAEALESSLKDRPQLRDYAKFCAAMEATGEAWPQWEPIQRFGQLGPTDYDLGTFNYFVFVQLAAEEQLARLSDRTCRLYLDLSVGASANSYDAWRYQSEFVTKMGLGAPPDSLFGGGQNWELPPLHPHRSRESGHSYFKACVQNHMRYAGLLRVDHIMGLHQLYWVPSELEATQGLYVRYPADELYAILLIESHRHKCSVVGEDLGTVPDYVRPAMAEAGLRRLYVAQFKTESHGQGACMSLRAPPRQAIASLGTHDTKTFAGWFDTTELTLAPEAVMQSWTEQLAEGPVEGVMITLEDLWLEKEPQNRPGTGLETPNWRHRITRTVQQIHDDDAIGDWLRHINSLRISTR